MTVNAAPAAAAPPVQQAQVVSVRTANGQIVQVSTNYITTLKCGIVVHVRLLIFDTSSHLYDLISHCTFISFGATYEVKNRPLLIKIIQIGVHR